MPAGIQWVVLPVFGDIDLAHCRARIIYDAHIPLGHGSGLEGVKECYEEQQ
jgi:hypothetical protein